MKIGSLDLGEHPLLLAPMESVTDPSFRSLCKDMGADMMFTEFVSARALVRSVNRTVRKLEITENERPVGIQLYGGDVDLMKEAAILAEEANPEVIDLNFGCPVKKIATKGSGSGLLRDIPTLLEITKTVVEAVKVPVTVKTRLGWDENSLVIETLAEQLQDLGIAALSIHGRTREQMYSGKADWTLIGKVKNNPRMNIPIIGNGDITGPEKARMLIDRYGVDALMVGRPSIGRPWIFKEIKHYMKTGELLPPMTIRQEVEILKDLVGRSVNYIDEKAGILHARRHLAKVFTELPDIRELRIKLLTEKSIQGVLDTLDLIADRYSS
ncbi:tRNA dihydrouridine synthase DusB [Carboxylicivirga caseinilyticus]|uniref:tRNA dihydrouridine synthase DusB n=1 Tax=Carboxylicivirga caseinilyticus TaxID=3417572 RepID=UPI003D34C5C7|nr:tRNA dihydrouridine synthase DusB [Marinilabiliaceae bacterium A049]